MKLADKGGAVLMTDLDPERLETARKRVAERGALALAVQADAGCWEDWQRVDQVVRQELGMVDVLVLNAGVASVGSVGDVSLNDWEWQLRVNLWGAIYGSHLYAPRMKAARTGFVLTVASAAAIASAPDMGPYNVAKAGVVSLSETLAQELGPSGVQVSVVCPTFFRSRLGENTRSTRPDLLRLTEKLVGRSKWTASAIADACLEGLERGALYILPQPDAKALWVAKRTLGARFTDAMTWFRTRAASRRGR